MTIRLLPSTTVNRIAAGEVVERPASALKELVENSIDAGAKRIDVIIRDGGQSFLSVSDDGKGMSPDELTLAVERYENRRGDVVDEANTIGTTYLRAQTLAEPMRSESLALLRTYTDTSIDLADRVPGSGRYEAALAALHMSPRGLANADKVAHLAAQAASEHAVRQVLVIDDRAETRNRLLMDLAHAGFVAASADNGAKGVSMAKNAPTLDVVIVRADLGDPSTTLPTHRHMSSIMAIDELKHDVRTKDMRVLVLLSDTNEAKVDALKEFFTNKYNDSLAGFITVPLDTAVAMEIVNTAAEAGDCHF